MPTPAAQQQGESNNMRAKRALKDRPTTAAYVRRLRDAGLRTGDTPRTSGVDVVLERWPDIARCTRHSNEVSVGGWDAGEELPGEAIASLNANGVRKGVHLPKDQLEGRSFERVSRAQQFNAVQQWTLRTDWHCEQAELSKISPFELPRRR